MSTFSAPTIAALWNGEEVSGTEETHLERRDASANENHSLLHPFKLSRVLFKSCASHILAFSDDSLIIIVVLHQRSEVVWRIILLDYI